MPKEFLFAGIAHVLAGAEFNKASFLWIRDGGIFQKFVECSESMLASDVHFFTLEI